MTVDWTMARVTKIYLVAGVLCLVLGLAVSVDLIDSKAYPMLTVALPAGAICLGLFFICYIFEKESVRFDEDERRVRSAGNRRDGTKPRGSLVVVDARQWHNIRTFSLWSCCIFTFQRATIFAAIMMARRGSIPCARWN
jgi:hypothetical protein